MPKTPKDIPAERMDGYMADGYQQEIEAEKKKLLEKRKALQTKLEIAKDANPPGDTCDAQRKVESWEAMRESSLSKLRQSVESQERQIGEMRAQVEAKILIIQGQLESTKQTLRAKEAFFQNRLEGARYKVEAIQNKACPNVRKVQFEIQAVEKEIEACTIRLTSILDSKDAVLSKKVNAPNWRDNDFKPPVAPFAPRPALLVEEDKESVSSDKTWTTDMIMEREAERKAKLAQGLRENKRTGRWEKPVHGEVYFNEGTDIPKVFKNEVINPYGTPGPDGDGVVNIEEFDEDVEGIDWKQWCFRKDVIRERLGLPRW